MNSETPTNDLTPTQRRIWFLQQMAPESPMFNLAAILWLKEGRFQTVEQAVDLLFERHPVLRASIIDVSGVPELVLGEKPELQILPVTGAWEATVWKEARSLAKRSLPLDSNLFKCFFLESQGRAAVVFVSHHIIMDGFSLSKLAREALEAYSGANRAQQVAKSVAEISDRVKERCRSFWRAKLGVTSPTILATRRPRPELQDYRGQTVTETLSLNTVGRVHRFAAQESCTPYAVYLACWFATLRKYTTESQLTVGCPTLSESSMTPAINGPAVNVLPCVQTLEPSLGFRDLLVQVMDAVHEIQEHVEVPFDELLREINPERDLSRTPVFQTLFSLMRYPDFSDSASIEQVSNGGAQFDLAMELAEISGEVTITCTGATSLYDREDISQIVANYVQILLAAIAMPEQRIRELPATLSSGLRRYVETQVSPGVAVDKVDVTETERLLATVWKELLDIDSIARDDNFFSLGGHSLLVAVMVARIRLLFGVELPLHAVFQEPTLVGLAQLVDQAEQAKTAPPIAIDRAGPLPLSYGQERIWFLHQMDPQHALFNIPVATRFRRHLSVALTEECLRHLILRHEILRAAFVVKDGQPRHEIVADVPLDVQYSDLRQSDDALKEVAQLSLCDAAAPFDLEKPPLFRVRLCQLAQEDFVLILVMHHIVTDNWSMSLMLKELIASYEVISAGRDHSPEPFPIQYIDYAVWQREAVREDRLRELRHFWLKYLEDAPVVSTLPTDIPRPAIQSYRAAQTHVKFPETLLADIEQLAETSNCTPFLIALGALEILLARYSGQGELVIGTPVASRPMAEFQKLIGTFVNILPVRVRVNEERTFRAFLRQIRVDVVSVFEHQDMPFERLVEAINPERSLSHAPIFQILFDFHTSVEQFTNLLDLGFELPELCSGASQFDLTLTFIREAERGAVSALYNCDLYERESIERLLQAYVKILQAIVASPDCLISDLSFGEVQEAIELLTGSTEVIEHTHLHLAFSKQAQDTPDGVALIEGEQQASYRQLDQQANGIAKALDDAGFDGGNVAVCLPSTAAAIASYLGIWKAGGTVVYLDPAQPEARLNELIEHSQAKVTLTTNAHAVETETINVNKVQPCDSFVARRCEIANLIYTSGSSGQPKGVLCTHIGFMNRLEAFWRDFPFEKGERCCHKSSLTFVDSVAEIFSPVLKGIPLVIAGANAREPAALIDLLERERISRVVMVPSLLNQLLITEPQLGACLPMLKHCFVSGEVLSNELARQHFDALPECRLINVYGSTEVAADVAWYEVKASDSGKNIPIGHPIANVQLRLLDGDARDVPPGAPGELCASGPCLAEGYWQDNALTAERYFRLGNSRFFRTGDLCRMRMDGALEYLGRSDAQLKIRGVRIEPAEVEATICTHPAVKGAAVVPNDDCTSLLAFVATRAEQSLSYGQLRAYLRDRLPEYQIPSSIVVRDSLPRTSSGKLDRKQLLAEPTHSTQPSSQYVAPRTELELQLCMIWEHILGIPRVGIRDDFFELGGHSLIAARLFAEIAELTGKVLPLATLFQAPTIDELARLLLDSGWVPPWKSLVAIQPGGSHPPLFCFHGGFSVLAYRDLANRLGAEYPVYGLQYPQKEEDIKEVESLGQLVAGYVAEIQSLQPAGPYHLAGSSAAGVVALEVARHLLDKGEEVGLTALFDSYGPGYPELLPTTTRWKYYMLHGFRRLEHHVGSLLMLPFREKINYFITRGRNAWAELRVAGIALLRRLGVPIEDHFPPWAVIFWQAMNHHKVETFDGEIVLFRASKLPLGIKPDPSLGWGKIVKNLRTYEIPGFHGAIISEPRCKTLIEKLRPLIDGTELPEHEPENTD